MEFEPFYCVWSQFVVDWVKAFDMAREAGISVCLLNNALGFSDFNYPNFLNHVSMAPQRKWESKNRFKVQRLN